MDSLESPEEGRVVGEPSLDRVFDVLADASRRYALEYLQDCSQPMPIVDLAAELAAWKQNVSLDEIPHESIQKEYLELHHTHLPKLKAANLVDVNAERNTVLLTESASSIDGFLKIAADED